MAEWQAGAYDKAKVRGRIGSELRSHKVVMYSYKISPYCLQAASLLKSHGVDFKTIDLGPTFLPGLLSAENAAVRAELGAMTGRTSMPHIFINGASVGGLIDGSPGLVPLIKQGQL